MPLRRFFLHHHQHRTTRKSPGSSLRTYAPDLPKGSTLPISVMAASWHHKQMPGIGQGRIERCSWYLMVIGWSREELRSRHVEYSSPCCRVLADEEFWEQARCSAAHLFRIYRISVWPHRTDSIVFCMLHSHLSRTPQTVSCCLFVLLCLSRVSLAQ